MSLPGLLFGRPLASSEDQEEKVGPIYGIPIFGLDALSSASYGPEAALTVLLPLGLAGLSYIVPISAAVIVLLIIVFFSYRQTIAAYPNGGGSYTVAKENLGDKAGLLAAAALMIDFLLNVAVAISAGVGALVSAAPALQPHTLAICLGILALLTIVNLRGMREPGLLFMAPTYLFVLCLFGVIAWGVLQVIQAGGHPRPAVPTTALPHATQAVSLWILLRAFASGCTAMTGVEAVSNGMRAFREPVVPNARTTLTIIIVILAILLAGIAFLSHAYGIAATTPGQAGFQSVLSQLTAAVAGRGIFYYVTVGAILLVLSLSANTSFAGFPALCRTVAVDGYLPRSLAIRGRRLVYTEGVVVLALMAAVLLIIFGGVTDRLIPLFAVGAFLAFTLSQMGMVGHWRKQKGPSATASLIVNATGAAATAVALLIILTAKFVEGAWIVVALAPLLIWLMLRVHKHYDRVAQETKPTDDAGLQRTEAPLVVVPMESWNSVSQKALCFALMISEQVQIVHVACEDTPPIDDHFKTAVQQQARVSGRPDPEIVELRSPFRFVIQPILDHVLELERTHPDRIISVVIAELVERRWYHYFLHNQRGELLSTLLLIKGDRRITIINVPWYLRA